MASLEKIGVGDTVYVDEFGAIKSFRIDRITPTRVCSGFIHFRKKDGLQIGTGSDAWAGSYATPINDQIQHKLDIQRVRKILWDEARYLEAIAKKADGNEYEDVKGVAMKIKEILDTHAKSEKKGESNG